MEGTLSLKTPALLERVRGKYSWLKLADILLRICVFNLWFGRGHVRPE